MIWLSWINCPARAVRSVVLTAALVFFSSCSTYPSFGENWKSVHRVENLQLVNKGMPGCTAAFNYALNYFRSHGVGIVVSDTASQKVVCAAPLPLLYRILMPLNVAGLQYGDAAWVTITGSKKKNAYLMVHEIRHLFGEEHGFDLPPLFFEPVA